MNWINRIATKYCIYHRKTSLSIVVFSVLIIVLIALINSVISTINVKSLEKLKDEYGEHHIVVFCETEDCEFNSDAVQEFGQIANFGNYYINGGEYNITIGSFDQNALRIGRIKLIEGRYPSSTSEIVLENHYKYLFERNLDIGDLVFLESDGEGAKHFTISGFIDDYQAYWENDDQIRLGYNDYPGGLILYPSETEDKSYRTYLVKLKNEPKDGYLTEEATIFAKSLEDKKYIFNSKAYMTEYNVLVRPILTFRTILTSCIFIVSVFVFYNLYVTHSRVYDDTTGVILDNLGATKIVSIIQKIMIFSLPWAVGVLIGIIFVFVVNILWFNALTINIWQLLLYFVIDLAIHFVSVLLALFLCKRSEKRSKGKLFKSNYIFEFAEVNIKKKYKRVLTLLLVFMVVSSVVFCISIDENRIKGIESEEEYYIISADCENYISLLAGTLDIASNIFPFDYTMVKRLERVFEGKVLDFSYNFMSSNLVFPQTTESEYWTRAKRRNPNDDAIFSSHINPESVPSIPKGIYTSPTFSTFTVTDRNKKMFSEQFPEIDVDKDLSLGKVVLYFAPVKTYEEYPEDDIKNPIIYEDYYKEGDTIKLAKLNYDGYLENAENNLSGIQYFEDTLIVTKIFREPFFYQDGITVVDFNEDPRIIWTEETAQSLKTVEGIGYVSICIDKRVTEAQYNELKKEFFKVVMTSKSCSIYESKFYDDFFTKLYKDIKIAYMFVFALLIVSIIVGIYALISSSLVENRKRIAVLRTFGIKAREVYIISLIEYFAYMTSGMITHLLINVIIIKLFSEGYLMEKVTKLQIVSYSLIIMIFYFIGFTIATILGKRFISKLFKEEISESIKNNE